MPKHVLTFVCLFVISSAVLSLLSSAQERDTSDAYTNAITNRARKIVGTLKIDNKLKSQSVQDLITNQYRSLRRIHDDRDAKIALAEEPSNVDGNNAIKTMVWIEINAENQLYALHRRFISQLSAELTSEQIERVKDGMTYGVVARTYAQYLKILPNLKSTDKKVIKALLTEAREYAMDSGTSEEKHGWFRKYKGKINNYLSEAGYDQK